METKENKTTISISAINIDGRYRIRDIDRHKVAVFKDRLKSGGTFPELILDQENNLIDGHQRYTAYMELSPGMDANVIIKHYDSIRERLVDAGRYNQKNGFPLNPYEEKRLAFRLLDEKASEEEIEGAVGRPYEVIERWYGQSIIVVNQKTGTKKQQARKGGISKTITEVSNEVYADIHKHYSGWSPAFHANQILKNLYNKTIDLTNQKNVDVLTELRDELEIVLLSCKKGEVA